MTPQELLQRASQLEARKGDEASLPVADWDEAMMIASEVGKYRPRIVHTWIDRLEGVVGPFNAPVLTISRSAWVELNYSLADDKSIRRMRLATPRMIVDVDEPKLLRNVLDQLDGQRGGHLVDSLVLQAESLTVAGPIIAHRPLVSFDRRDWLLECFAYVNVLWPSWNIELPLTKLPVMRAHLKSLGFTTEKLDKITKVSTTLCGGPRAAFQLHGLPAKQAGDAGYEHLSITLDRDWPVLIRDESNWPELLKEDLVREFKNPFGATVEQII